MFQVTTLAGNDDPGYADGSGTAASFNYPLGVAVNEDGGIFVADANNHRIRKISPSGVVTTLAGSGVRGFADGQGLEAQFNYPSCLAVTKKGCLVVADNDNHRIRTITPDGKVTTLAGGDAGFADGDSSSASFNDPCGVAIDHDGNILVADASNNRIRLITAAGQVSTLAGSGESGFSDGEGNMAKFKVPTSVAVDCDGSVIVADLGNHRIRMVSPQGRVSTIAGSGIAGFSDGMGSAAMFTVPEKVSVDGDGNIIMADSGNGRVRMITQEGQVTTIAGSGDSDWEDGLGTAASFKWPAGVTVDGDGNIIVADIGNNRIRKIAAQLTPPRLKGPPPILPSTREMEMAAMLEDPCFADVVFQVEQTDITAHKAVLASRSEYFKTMLCSAFREGSGGGGRGAAAAASASSRSKKARVETAGGMSTGTTSAAAESSSSSASSSSTIITVGETTPSAFKALLRYLYTDAFEFEDKDILSVMRKAKEYQLERLYGHTVRYCHDHICEENVVTWLIHADEYGLEELRALALEFLIRNFGAVRSLDGGGSLALLNGSHLFMEVMLAIKITCSCGL